MYHEWKHGDGTSTLLPELQDTALYIWCDSMLRHKTNRPVVRAGTLSFVVCPGTCPVPHFNPFINELFLPCLIVALRHLIESGEPFSAIRNVRANIQQHFL